MSFRGLLNRVIKLSSLVEEAYKPGDRVYLKPGEEPPHGEKVETGPKGGQFFVWRAGAGHGGWERKRRLARQRARQEAGDEGKGVRAEGREIPGGRDVPGGRPVQRRAVAGPGPRRAGKEARSGGGGEADQLRPAGGQTGAITKDKLVSSASLRDLGIQGGINEHNMRIVEVAQGTFPERPGLSETRAMTKTITRREAQAEIARYEMDLVLGHDNVPDVLEYRDEEAGQGESFLMRWVDDAGFGGTDAHRIHAGQVLTPRQLLDFARITAMDAILGNTDRHIGNYLVDDANDRVWAIDSGFGQATRVDGSSALRYMAMNLPSLTIEYDYEQVRLALVQAAEEAQSKLPELTKIADRRFGQGTSEIFERSLDRFQGQLSPDQWPSVLTYWRQSY